MFNFYRRWNQAKKKKRKKGKCTESSSSHKSRHNCHFNYSAIIIYYLHVVALEKLKTMDHHDPAVKPLDTTFTRFSQAHQPTSRKVLSGQSFWNRYHLDEAINWTITIQLSNPWILDSVRHISQPAANSRQVRVYI